MTITHDEILQQIIANAMAEGQKLVKQKQEKLRTDRKTLITNWKQTQLNRENAAHEARIKTGTELAETFIRETADAFLRLTSTEQALAALQTLKIVFIPGKGDQGSSTTVSLIDGTKRVNTFFKASLEQYQSNDTRVIEKLQRQTGFIESTPIAMMQEIARLQEQVQKLSSNISQLNPVVEAAQEVLLAQANETSLDKSLAKLEQAFIPSV